LPEIVCACGRAGKEIHYGIVHGRAHHRSCAVCGSGRHHRHAQKEEVCLKDSLLSGTSLNYGACRERSKEMGTALMIRAAAAALGVLVLGVIILRRKRAA
jgi:hypothetical protein